jgi:hypothetical protein
MTVIEKRKFEILLGMSSGYVADFSNRTFAEFILDSTGVNIWDERFSHGSGSKANRLRAFWNNQPNHVVAKLLSDLLEAYGNSNPKLKECQQIIQRLKQSAPVLDIDAISPNFIERSFETLANAVRDAINRNEPESGLDRLHKYVRVLCEKYNIVLDREKPLHSLFGEYVKKLKENGLIESEMTERILKSSISTMESFNRVRNEHSLAHDNPVLNYNESLLIFNHVTSAIKFIAVIETEVDNKKRKQEKCHEIEDEVPF